MLAKPSEHHSSWSSIDAAPITGPAGFAGDHPCTHDRVFGNLTVTHKGDASVTTPAIGGGYSIGSGTSARVYNVLSIGSAEFTADWFARRDPKRHDFIFVSASIVGDEAFVHRAGWMIYDGHLLGGYNVYSDHFVAMPGHSIWDNASVKYGSVSAVGRPTMTFPDYPAATGIASIPRYDIGAARPFASVNVLGHSLQKAALSSIHALITPDDWGELSLTAVQDATPLSINTTQFIKELLTLKSTVQDFIDLVSGDISPKTLASLWLSLKYGLRLTLKDAYELGKSLPVARKPKFTCVRSMGSKSSSIVKWPWVGAVATTVYHTKIYYDKRPEPIAGIGTLLFELDSILKLQNVWDIVPYTFVIDWFLDVGSMLGRIDAHTYQSMLSVNSILSSLRSTISKDLHYETSDGFVVSGSISAIHYNRWISHTFDLWDIFRIKSPGQFKNLPELASILIQKY